MLAQPPIFAPLEPVVFPPSTSSSASPAPLPFPTSTAPVAAPCRLRGSHRHARAARDALDLVRRLADQVDGRGGGGELDQENDGSEDLDAEQGIIANLESHGWTYQETTQGVRIFHSSSQDPGSTPPDLDRSTRSAAFSPTRSTASARGPGAPHQPASRGLRADEALPFFRGEGWIEGSWKREDVAATILSLGARAVWDPRMDASKSQVVQHLNKTDSLTHLCIRSNLVAPRDASFLSTMGNDERHGKTNVTYVVGTSVEDPLIPRSGQRTTIHINGFALRSLSRPPDFEPPAPALLRPEASPPVRPPHRRTRSSASVMQTSSALLATVPLPPVPGAGASSPPPPQRPQLYGSATHIGNFNTPQSPPPLAPPPLAHTTSFYTSASSSYNASPSLGPGELPGPYPRFPFGPPAFAAHPAQKRPSPLRPSLTGPGLGVSMVVRASAGMNLPQTTVNQLSVLLPLNIAAIGRFLAGHGFAPHIVRTGGGGGVKVREEEFDAQVGRYRTTFTASQALERESAARIRFYGGAFGRARFHVEVRHVEPGAWRLEYDVPPGAAQEGRLDVYRESEEVGGEGSGQWRSRLVVTLRGAPDEVDARQERRASAASLLSPIDGDLPSRDPALQPGPLGGCTIVIPLSATQHGLPVIVTVARSTSDSASIPLARMRGMSSALAQASQVVLDDHFSLCDSVEDLLACMTEGEARADMCLKGTRLVLRELDEAREREAQSAAVAAAAAAFAKRGRRGSGSTTRTMQRRDGSSARRGSAESVAFSAPFSQDAEIPQPGKPARSKKRPVLSRGPLEAAAWHASRPPRALMPYDHRPSAPTARDEARFGEPLSPQEVDAGVLRSVDDGDACSSTPEQLEGSYSSSSWYDGRRGIV
ncbi:hypothetical protein JCM9279_001028 [Rhodotorula babjevae]